MQALLPPILSLANASIIPRMYLSHCSMDALLLHNFSRIKPPTSHPCAWTTGAKPGHFTSNVRLGADWLLAHSSWQEPPRRPFRLVLPHLALRPSQGVQSPQEHWGIFQYAH